MSLHMSLKADVAFVTFLLTDQNLNLAHQLMENIFDTNNRLVMLNLQEKKIAFHVYQHK